MSSWRSSSSEDFELQPKNKMLLSSNANASMFSFSNFWLSIFLILLVIGGGTQLLIYSSRIVTLENELELLVANSKNLRSKLTKNEEDLEASKRNHLLLLQLCEEAQNSSRTYSARQLCKKYLASLN